MLDAAIATDVKTTEWVGVCAICLHSEIILQLEKTPAPAARSACWECMNVRRCGTMFWSRAKH